MSVKCQIHVARLQDGTFLAVSVDSPKFCVTAESKSEAQRKANAARLYFEENKHRALSVTAVNAHIIRPAFEALDVNC